MKKPWVKKSSNVFEFNSFDFAHKAIHTIKEPLLSKILLFQISELHSFTVVIPTKFLETFESYESLLEMEEPTIEEPLTPPPPPQQSIDGIPLIGDLRVGYDFLAPHNPTSLGQMLQEKGLLLNRLDFLGVVCAYHKSLYGDFEKALPLIQLTCKYAAYGLPSYLELSDRQEIQSYWASEPTIHEINLMWEEASVTNLGDLKTLPFHYLYGDYLANGQESPYLAEVLDGAKKLFYSWQMFMVLTCYRFLISCTFSSLFNTEFKFNESKVSNLIDAPNSVESIWNFYKNDPRMSFLFDPKVSLDFDAYGDNEALFNYLVETHGVERLRQLWSTRLGDRLPTAASCGSLNPRETMTSLFDKNMEIHRTKNWQSFLDDPEFGFYWAVRYNISSKIRHTFRRSMIEHMKSVGGLSL